jgi:cysteine desulfurase
MIYLDNSATTRIDDAVLDAMMPWLRDGYGNASSQYGLGLAARVAIEDARSTIADCLGAHPAEIIFTSGGTESNNTIIKSCVGPSGLAGTVVHGATEHHAVIHPCQDVEAGGIQRHVIPVDYNGIIDLDALAAIDAPYQLVSVMAANNETGAIQPLQAIRDVCKGALLHTDAVQAFGKVPLNLTELGVDFASISAHKIHGPKGVGAMFIRKGIDFKAHQTGGAQERNRRSGTEPVALIVGLAMAAKRAVESMQERNAHCERLTSLARELVLASIPDVRRNCLPTQGLATIVHLSFLDAEQLDGEAILQLLDMNGVAASNGSACVSGTMQPSHVLKAMGRSDAEAKAAVRLSVSYHTTEDEIRNAIAILADAVREMRVVTHN